jgi:flavodoxin
VAVTNEKKNSVKTTAEEQENDVSPMKSLLVLLSYHHHNTEKIANVFADVLDAPIRIPQQVNPEELQEYGLVGFGSGIYGGKHHEALLDLADRLPQVTNRRAFIFSTSSDLEPPAKNHSALREKLQSKGYVIVDEFKRLYTQNTDPPMYLN